MHTKYSGFTVRPRLLLHPYRFCDNSLTERDCSPLSRIFDKNLNMNTQKQLDQCEEQLNAKHHAQLCCHATHENKVNKVPQTPLTLYSRFPISTHEKVKKSRGQKSSHSR